MGTPTEPRAPDDYLVSQVVARAGRDDWDAFAAQLSSTGGCTNPVRLRGRSIFSKLASLPNESSQSLVFARGASSV